MSSGAPRKKEEGSSGAPAWVMTFADLMSLLMCFFVLLLSFAEMDILKFKQVAGSMKMAFGVQRDIKVKEPPKGTSVIAREFSPGRPTPTPMTEIRQNTIDETRQTLEFTDAMSEDEDAEGMESGEQDAGAEPAPIQKHSQNEASAEALLESGETDEELEKLAEMTQQLQQELMTLAGQLEENAAADTGPVEQVETVAEITTEIEQQVAEMMNKVREANPGASEEPVNEETVADAQKLLQAMAPEIEKGIVSVKTLGNKIVLRIKEKGSFPSGSSDLKGGFMPVMGKLRESLQTIEGKVVVAGHTDNVPIKTERFRSNWELSSSRAVTVVHELLENSSLDQKRFAVEGHGDAHPIAPNDSVENRALNRRVELTIIQGEDSDEVSELSPDGEISPIENNRIEDPARSMPGPVESTEDTVGNNTTAEPVNAAANEIPQVDQVLQDSADGNSKGLSVDKASADEEPVSMESSPITDSMEPVIKGGIEAVVKDPFAGVVRMNPESTTVEAGAGTRTGNATIDAGELRNKLKSIMDRLNNDETVEGQKQ